MTQVDVVIVGGGAVGLSLALDLTAQTEMSIAVTESQPFASEQSGHPVFDSRYLALGNASLEYLQHLMTDAPIVAALQACPIQHIQVSDQGYIGKCHLSADTMRVAQLGAVAPIQVIGQALNNSFQQALATRPSRVKSFSPDAVKQVEQHRDYVDVTLTSGQALRAKLIVIAEGGRSALKSQLGYTEQQVNYQQTAIIANVQMQQPHHAWAYERFTQHGPLALLPILAAQPNQDSAVYSLVWTHDSADQQTLERLVTDSEFFKQQLSLIIGQHHGVCERVSERVCYPLTLKYVEQLHRHRSIVIGNAAQALHPIAGQGLNLGLRDVTDAVATLKSCSAETLGDWRSLAEYAQRRDRDRDAIITATNGLVKGFSNHFWPLVLGRNGGLLLMNHVESLKYSFAQRAMGYRYA